MRYSSQIKPIGYLKANAAEVLDVLTECRRGKRAMPSPPRAKISHRSENSSPALYRRRPPSASGGHGFVRVRNLQQ